MTTLLLPVSDIGQQNNDKGVIFFPSQPLPPSYTKGSILYNLRLFVPSSSQISRDGIIWINTPPSADIAFNRSKYYKHIISNSFTNDNYINFPIYHPGPYNYYISYRDSETNTLKTTRKFYFVVLPSLYVQDEFIPINSIVLESVVSKWLGDKKDWDLIFDRIQQKGYNMVHFTPLQQRGESNSPYSIFDQLTYDPTFFNSEDDVKSLVDNLHKKKMLSITDVVFNHTANNSTWLREFPDSGYNKETAPHLTSAIELDLELQKFSRNLKKFNYPVFINSIHDLLHLMDGIKIHVLANLKLWEFYVIDTKQTLIDLEANWSNELNDNDKSLVLNLPKDISLQDLAKFITENCINKTFGKRFENKIELSKFNKILIYLYPNSSFDDVKSTIAKVLDEINLPCYKEYDNDVADIMEQLFNRIKYLRLDDNGPKLGEINDKNPLTEQYFTCFKGKDGKDYQLANNGWIWDGNPLIDFASNKTKSYLLREVIIWGDCVKLRYGNSPEDSPHLWKRMGDYVLQNAKIFDGFRIDNCHSTPIHVGEYLLDLARSVNPNLYVVAELFTGSEDLDNIVVERLGISSLIREAMQAWSVDELSQLIHRHAGLPIGSFQTLPLDEYAYPEGNIDSLVEEPLSEIKLPIILRPVRTHAMFMDCTHDNETPYDKRTVEDTLPNAALVSLCSTAIGSVFGYDECYPHLLNVVNETRKYTIDNHGIGDIKARLNQIRKSISNSSYNDKDHEMHVHHEGQFITLQRFNCKTGEGWFLVARTKFSNNEDEQWMQPIELKGTKASFEFAYALEKLNEPLVDDKNVITSVPVRTVELSGPHIEFSGQDDSIITLPEYFPQGSILMLKTSCNEVNESLDDFIRHGAIEAAKDLNLIDLNALLYKCESEERDASGGNDGVYNVPNHGRLVYAGIQGWISELKILIKNNDLSHPLAEHLRQGHWALDYVVTRLNKYSDVPAIDTFKNWLYERFQKIKLVPFFLVPRYFALTVGIAYEALRYKTLSLLSAEIQRGNLFVQNLGLTTVQMTGLVKSTSLFPCQQVPSMAAGLPHFSYDYMRCWGRDIFISLRGLLLATGRTFEAKQHILGFAATLKHGLIPNLLDAGRNPRYNARDAAWFFIQAIQDYIQFVPNGEEILKEKVKRRFPLDDRYIKFDDPEAFSYESSIEEIIYEILSRHAQGISYREANAGVKLDSQMKDEGFNVTAGVDWETGFVYGGSQFNCGTWMDKMGESEKAGSKGVPGTPRDGSAIEIVGLLKSALRFVIELHNKGLFEKTSVKKSSTGAEEISFKDWELLVLNNFERCFYIPKSSEDDHKYDVDPSIINRRGIYKDLYKSGKPYEDYQLRPNFAIAMTVAPELFTPELALDAILIADKVIRGPVGMRTLDPSDLNYRPYYNNSEDSTDFATAKGRNYHQGPEWVWVYGYFLRAFHKFHYQNEQYQNVHGEPSSELNQLVNIRLKHHRIWIAQSEWAGLPELTNKDGALCWDSSPTQAWSSSCILDFYLDLWDSGLKY